MLSQCFKPCVNVVLYTTNTVCSGNKGIQDGIDKVNRPVPECSFHQSWTISISVRGMLTRQGRPVPAGEVFTSNCVKYVRTVRPLDPGHIQTITQPVHVPVRLNWFDEDLFSDQADRSVIQYKFTLIDAVSPGFCKIWLDLIRALSHSSLGEMVNPRVGTHQPNRLDSKLASNFLLKLWDCYFYFLFQYGRLVTL